MNNLGIFILSVQEDIDEIIFYLYDTILGGYWPKERKNGGGCVQEYSASI